MLEINSIAIVDKNTMQKPVLNVPGVTLGSATVIIAGVTAAVQTGITIANAVNAKKQREAMEKENAVINSVKEWYRDVLTGYNGRTFNIADRGGFPTVGGVALSGVITNRPEIYGVVNNGYIYLNLDFPETFQGAVKNANHALKQLETEYSNLQKEPGDGRSKAPKFTSLVTSARKIRKKLDDRLKRYGMQTGKPAGRSEFYPLYILPIGWQWWHDEYWNFAKPNGSGGVDMMTLKKLMQFNWTVPGYNRNPPNEYKAAKFQEMKAAENKYNEWFSQLLWMEEAGLMPWAIRGFNEKTAGSKINPLDYGANIAQLDFDSVVQKITEINSAITAENKRIAAINAETDAGKTKPETDAGKTKPETPISGLKKWWGELTIGQKRATMAAAGVGVFLAIK